MSLRINQNVAAYNAHRNLMITDAGLGKSLERLSSGLRINRAADDAAGLSISEKLRGQVSGLNQAARNAQDGISLIQTAEGALSETHAILQRVRELSVQSANGSLTGDDRTSIQTEVSSLLAEVTRIATTTSYNSNILLTGNLGEKVTITDATLTSSGISNVTVGTGVAQGSGSFAISAPSASGVTTITGTVMLGTGTGVQTTGSITTTTPAAGSTYVLSFASLGVTITVNNNLAALTSGNGEFYVEKGSLDLHVGANASQTISVSIASMTSADLQISGINVDSVAGANAALGLVDTAVSTVSTQRATLGAAQNRLEHTIANLGVSSENLAASESRIRDVDMAAEMVIFTRNQIMVQAGTAMLAQANAVPQTVLQLLK